MVNFRKLKADLSPTLLKEGQSLHKKGVVQTVKITSFETDKFRLNCSVVGNFENAYACEIEIDRKNSSVIDSDCDCPHKYDCQHLAAVLFYLEDHLDELVVSFSKESDPTLIEGLEEEEKVELLETFKEAETKEVIKKGKKYEKELVQEYTAAAHVLSCSPFFVPEDVALLDKAELVVIFNTPPVSQPIEVRLALRLPFRSKPLHVYNVKDFLNAIRYQESLYIGSRRFSFSQNSFSPESAQILKMIMDFGHYSPSKEERFQSIVLLEAEAFGTILAHAYDR